MKWRGHHFGHRFWTVEIARVFARRTRGTPNDASVFVGEPGLFPPEVDPVHISVAFTWDLPEAERLARAWKGIAPVRIGGPATGMCGEEFTPGQYLRKGYVITSRGCPNRCWFCKVPEREGNEVRELPIYEGYNIVDDNLLACSDRHIWEVIRMLRSQKERPEFTGGLEAARFTREIAELVRSVKPKQVFFAYDTESDREPLRLAVELRWKIDLPIRRRDVNKRRACIVRQSLMRL